MNIEDKIKHLIKKGYTCDPINGIVYGYNGGILNTKSVDGYKRMCFKLDGKVIWLKQHQFIWYYVYGSIPNCIDHINRDRGDNRIDNLRSVSKQQNAWNTNAKGFRNRKGRYDARIMVNYEYINLGTFTNENDAKQAYLDAKKKYHIINAN